MWEVKNVHGTLNPHILSRTAGPVKLWSLTDTAVLFATD